VWPPDCRSSQIAFSLALHVALERVNTESGMTLWLRGLRRQPYSASFSDEACAAPALRTA
jgi:hypothetical protein